MDVKKVKTDDLGKLAKLMKASGKQKNSGAKEIAKARKDGAVLKKKVPVIQKMDKTDPDFDK